MQSFTTTNLQLYNVRESIIRLNEKKAALVEAKQELQDQQSIYNRRVRGKPLPKIEYDSIVKKQAEVGKKTLQIDKGIREVCLDISKRSLLETEVMNNIDKTTTEKLTSLRDKYMGFASDMTRVASMRAMASRFSEDLEEIIKSIIK